jgi:ankyrin repeat protein
MRLTAIVWICSTLALSAQERGVAEAVRAGRYADALQLLDKGADPNKLDTRRNAALMWAAASGQIAVARALLDRQALVNFPHYQPNYDALHLAAQNQQAAMIDFLLSRGADPGLRDWDPTLGENRDKLVRIGKFVNGVKSAVWDRNTSRLEVLLAESPPDAVQSSLNSALWVAAQLGDARLVQKLLDRKANPVADWEGRSALEVAADAKHAEVVKLLISRGIRTELVRQAIRMSGPIYPEGWFPSPVITKKMTLAVRDAFGETAREPDAIAAALKTGDAASLNKLIQSGAYVYWATESGFPLRARDLKQATERGYSEIVRMLSTIHDRSESLAEVLNRILTACPERRSDDCARINTVANWYLRQLKIARWKANYSRDYFLSLEAMADALQASPEVRIVKEIADELEARREYCVQNNVDMGGAVTVQVHTRNQQKEVPNWQVYYLLRIYESNPAVAPGAFLKWSSPTSEVIEPGRYWFWAKDPATDRESQRKLVPLSGAQTVAVDLYVP